MALRPQEPATVHP